MSFTFPAMVTWDPNGKQSVKNVSFQVYAVTDTTFSTPLAITDTFGNPLPGNFLNAGTQGIFPQFQQATNSTVVITDATHVYAWTINCVQQDSATAAFINTSGSATQAALSATYVGRSESLGLSDSDGTPYFSPPAFGLDADGTPYFDPNGVPSASAIRLFTDSDAVPYFA